jgi:hypothetical protein
MNTLSEEYLSRAAMWLVITTVTYLLMNGAQLFETFAIVSKWVSSPPESFHIFRSKYGLDFKIFWIVFHSIHEITFILAIIFCWQLPDIRTWLLILFAIHFAVRIWTIVYFAPKIIGFQRMSTEQGSNKELLQQTTIWKHLNYLRVAVFMAVSFGLIPLLSNVLRLLYSS